MVKFETAVIAIIVALVILFAGCVMMPQTSKSAIGRSATALQVTSPAFPDGGRIPARYTADGDDLSPPLAWSGAPAGASEFALICEDPDAPGGTFTHWVIYRIPGSYDRLDDGVTQVAELDNGAMQGENSFGKIGYGGPSPPRGKPHHYLFRVYALDALLNLPAGITKGALLKAMQGHVMAEGTLTGLYGRR